MAGPAAPLARPAGAPLLPLLPLLWYFIHSCSLPYVIYYFVSDLTFYVCQPFYFYIIFLTTKIQVVRYVRKTAKNMFLTMFIYTDKCTESHRNAQNINVYYKTRPKHLITFSEITLFSNIYIPPSQATNIQTHLGFMPIL